MAFEPAAGASEAEAGYAVEESAPAPVTPSARRQAEPAATDSATTAPPEPAVKRKKAKRKKELPDPEKHFKVYVAAGAVGLVAMLALGFALPHLGVFNPTLDEVAGLYVSAKEPALTIRLYADGSCHISEPNIGMGLEYTLEGRTIHLEPPEGFKPKPLDERIEHARRHRQNVLIAAVPNIAQMMVIEYGDLSYKGSSIVSSTKGRYNRAEGPAGGSPALEVPSGGRPLRAKSADALKAGGAGILAITDDASLAVAANGEGTVLVWEPKAARKLAGWQTGYPGPMLALTPDGSRLWVMSRAIRVLNPRTGEVFSPPSVAGRLEIAGTGTRVPIFSRDGRFLFRSNGKIVQVIDVEKGRELHQSEVYDGRPDLFKGIMAVEPFPDGRTCLALSVVYGAVQMRDNPEPKFLQWWNVETGQVVRSVELPNSIRTNGLGLLALSADGKLAALYRAASAEHGHAIELRNAEDGVVVGEIPLGQVIDPRLMTFAGGSKTLVVEEGNDLVEWDVEARKPLRRLERKRRWDRVAVARQAGIVMYVNGPELPRFFDLAAWKTVGESAPEPAGAEPLGAEAAGEPGKKG